MADGTSFICATRWRRRSRTRSTSWGSNRGRYATSASRCAASSMVASSVVMSSVVASVPHSMSSDAPRLAMASCNANESRAPAPSSSASAVSAARPSAPAGSSQPPVRTSSSIDTIGTLRCSTVQTGRPLASSWRWVRGRWSGPSSRTNGRRDRSMLTMPPPRSSRPGPGRDAPAGRWRAPRAVPRRTTPPPRARGRAWPCDSVRGRGRTRRDRPGTRCRR